jgi:hypothetical protein
VETQPGTFHSFEINVPELHVNIFLASSRGWACCFEAVIENYLLVFLGGCGVRHVRQIGMCNRGLLRCGLLFENVIVISRGFARREAKVLLSGPLIGRRMNERGVRAKAWGSLRAQMISSPPFLHLFLLLPSPLPRHRLLPYLIHHSIPHLPLKPVAF